MKFPHSLKPSPPSTRVPDIKIPEDTDSFLQSDEFSGYIRTVAKELNMEPRPEILDYTRSQLEPVLNILSTGEEFSLGNAIRRKLEPFDGFMKIKAEYDPFIELYSSLAPENNFPEFVMGDLHSLEYIKNSLREVFASYTRAGSSKRSLDDIVLTKLKKAQKILLEIKNFVGEGCFVGRELYFVNSSSKTKTSKITSELVSSLRVDGSFSTVPSASSRRSDFKRHTLASLRAGNFFLTLEEAEAALATIQNKA